MTGSPVRFLSRALSLLQHAFTLALRQQRVTPASLHVSWSNIACPSLEASLPRQRLAQNQVHAL